MKLLITPIVLFLLGASIFTYIVSVGIIICVRVKD